jgi:hypothetical protein
MEFPRRFNFSTRSLTLNSMSISEMTTPSVENLFAAGKPEATGGANVRPLFNFPMLACIELPGLRISRFRLPDGFDRPVDQL